LKAFRLEGEQPMKIVSISQHFFSQCTQPNELLDNTNRRPYVVIMKLDYKGKKYDFALPFRSNISATVPADLYFSLPPTSSTRVGNKSGLHLIKMFPVDKHYFEKFRINPGSSYDLNSKIIQKKKKDLIQLCQDYLNRVESGEFISYRVNIDQIILDIGL